ncbi:hypothetical protein CR513_49174, partial [Mucuna pruriens]
MELYDSRNKLGYMFNKTSSLKKDFLCYDIEKGRIFKFSHDLNFKYDPIQARRNFPLYSVYFLLRGMKTPNDQSCLIKETPTKDLSWRHEKVP